MHEELKHTDLTMIRAVCSRQSWSQWTLIASRERLYQFISMSDDASQKVMRQEVMEIGDNGARQSAIVIAASQRATWLDTQPLNEEEDMRLDETSWNMRGCKR